MKYREVETLKLSFDWVNEFILTNGITEIPEYWAFIIETCGMLSWVMVFLFCVSLFVGYSRQMSHFYFMVEHLTGKKSDNPYKPAFIFFIIWCALYIICGGVSVTGVYFLKYGYLYGILTGLGTLAALASLFYAGYKVAEPRKHEPHYPYHYHQYPPQQHPQYHPAHLAVPQPHYGAISPQPMPQDQQYLQIPSAQQGANIVPQADHHFEEALQLLGLEPGFTKALLKKRYHDLAKKFHSDKDKSASGIYLKIKSCYEYLLPFAK